MAVVAPERASSQRAETRWPTRDLILGGTVVVGAVLRLWDLGATRPSIDETYTALAARLPVADLVRHIDATDPHGPLAYLLLQPVAGLTSDVGTLRLASAMTSIAALVVMAVWQRRAGLAGLVATVVFALSPFQLLFARQIRMYGLLALAGVTAAWCAQRWLEQGGRRWAIGAATAGLVAALSHAAGPILLVALMAIPLLRRDRAAWELRAAVGTGLMAFAVLWGPHAWRWSHDSGALPVATPRWASIVVNETIAPAPENRWIVLPLLLAGALAILMGRGARVRVWMCLFAVPVLALYVASLQRSVLVPKSLVPFAWGTSVAMGALCGWAMERWRLAGLAIAGLLALVIVPLVPAALRQDEGSGVAAQRIFDRAGADDGFAVVPGRWQTESLVRWFGDHETDRALEPAVGVDGLEVYAPAGVERSDRLWFVSMEGDVPPETSVPCGPRELVGSVVSVQCLVVPRG